MTTTPMRRAVMRRGVESLLWALATPALLVMVLLGLAVPGALARASALVDRRQAWGDGRAASTLRPLRRPLALLATDLLLGALSAVIWALIALGAAVAGSMVVGAATGGPVLLLDGAPPGAVTWTTVSWFALPGVILLFLALSGLGGAGHLSRRARTACARPPAGALERRVDELSATLDDVVLAVDAERRRIERDLHDGVQQRVVALSLLLARLGRAAEPHDQEQLRAQAQREAQAILEDLRQVSWRLYPAMLARDGLAEALEALCDRTALPTRLELPEQSCDRPDLATETAAFFVASEAVSNVIKHAGARRIEVRVRHASGALAVSVRDDGAGGADPGGPGLSGIASRVAARHGTLEVTSPRGGPTTVEARFPCA